MSQTARRQDAIKYNEFSLKCLPGQILGRCSVRCISENMLDIYSPASVTKCHRIRVHHIWIQFSILQIPFRLVLHGVFKDFGVM